MLRQVVTQLLAELDGVGADNDGVFVLAASTMPWDVDPALRRPGRFDRTVLVVPPDDEARHAILTDHPRDRPVENVRLGPLVARTAGFSDADLAHLCEAATERALLDSVATGTARMITHDDLLAAAAELRPSTGPWFTTARQVALYANGDGAYDDLVAHMKEAQAAVTGARRRAALLVDARQYERARPELARAMAEDPDDGPRSWCWRSSSSGSGTTRRPWRPSSAPPPSASRRPPTSRPG